MNNSHLLNKTVLFLNSNSVKANIAHIDQWIDSKRNIFFLVRRDKKLTCFSHEYFTKILIWIF